jgi:hypothetical protein
MARRKGNGTSLTYGAYLFRAKDPAIDEYRTLVEDYFGHRVTNKDLASISEAGGPTSGTMGSWFFGKTRRPQSATLEAAGRAIGYKRKWVKMT